MNKCNTNEYLNYLLKAKNDVDELLIMTDEEWQKIFCQLKFNNKPSTDTRMKRNPTTTRIVGKKYGLSDVDNHQLQDASYCKFINDVLGQIRKGKTDYCYHTYQVKDLLRFEPTINAKLVRGIIYIQLHDFYTIY